MENGILLLDGEDYYNNDRLELLPITNELNKKNNEYKMEENKLNIPAGEYTDKDGNVFIIAEDGTITKKEQVIEETLSTEEVVKEKEVVKEEMSEPIEEEVDQIEDVVEEEMAEPVVEPSTTYTKEEVDAKFEELYKLIGDMQAEEVEDIEEVVEPQQTQLSVNERFEAFNRFFTNSRVDL